MEAKECDVDTGRGAKDLEAKIMEIGPERVCAFVGETMLGSLVGDVPPAPNYWRYIREVCNRYGVHLILDEIYCGNGRTGRSYCCSWDEVIPDFICLGKPLGAGYVPLSAVASAAPCAIASGAARWETRARTARMYRASRPRRVQLYRYTLPRTTSAQQLDDRTQTTPTWALLRPMSQRNALCEAVMGSH